ncbi:MULTISPECIES: Shedu immune nuclease family protein [unclassified Myroides]|uniref:Shedu immune nuclease family protein n=1 Tax=unclassified Myroides TaxID=2642485 RepID=UPI00310109DD
MSSRTSKPNYTEIIDNYKLEQLYNHKIENGRFFKIVFANDEKTAIQLASKTFMQIKYLPSRNDIEGLDIIKIVNGKESQKVSFSKFNFAQLELFLNFIHDIDLSTVAERRLKLADNSLDILDEETKKNISTLLQGNEGAEVIQELLDNDIITSQDIVNTGYRKNQLKIFERLLNEKNYLQQYKLNEEDLSNNTKDEIAWQHFFNKNPWIFGYGLDYRYQSILQKEFSASNTDAAGKGQVNADFLIGDNYFTTFVELKTPDTDLFVNTGSGQNRSGSWCLSTKLIYAVSQILEQKAVGQIKLETEPYNSLGEKITQKGYDSKCILVVGNLNKEVEESQDSSQIKEIKRKTFELFRRDSRNIEIITYDELYLRAYHICYKKI